MCGDPDIRKLAPGDLGTDLEGIAEPGVAKLRDRCLLILVGLTGAGKTTTAEQLATTVPLAAVLPDRRTLTDSLILPAMTGRSAPVTDRVERFRLTAAFKQRYPGGMGDVLRGLLLPAGLPPGPILFDGLRGEAEVTAAARLPRARFLVLDCPPEGRLRRLCGRDDPFDQAGVMAAAMPSSGADAIRQALGAAGFDALVDADRLERLVRTLAGHDIAPEEAARGAAIIVEESRHYDPALARSALLRLAADRTLVLDTETLGPAAVGQAVADWMKVA